MSSIRVRGARFAPRGKVIYSEIALQRETLFAIGASHEAAQSPRQLGGLSIQLFCYVDDVDSHHSTAKAEGATILSPPDDKFWGDRSYDALDCEGYRWTFRKIVKNVPLPQVTAALTEHYPEWGHWCSLDSHSHRGFSPVVKSCS